MARANIRQIEAFNAVMKGGSVTKAAEELFISQPAVSKLIQAFEQSCGFALFTRGQGRLLPTAEARRLFSETASFMTGVARIENTARAIRESERGEIAIAAFPALSLRALPRFVARFMAERPGIQMSIITRNSPDMPNSMLTRAADFALSLTPTQETGLNCSPFAELTLICALPAGHPLAAEPVIEIAWLDGENVIGLGRDEPSQRVIAEEFARADARRQTRIDVHMADTACVLVCEGQGVAIVPSVVAMGWNEAEIVFRPIRTQPKISIWLYTSVWEPMPNLSHLLLERIRQGIARHEALFAL